MRLKRQLVLRKVTHFKTGPNYKDRMIDLQYDFDTLTNINKEEMVK